jgi:hypothetical protein
MTSLERRLSKLEAQLGTEDRPSLGEILRKRLAEAQERRRLGVPAPLPAIPADSDDPLIQRLRQAMIRAQQARARLQAGDPGPW